MIHSNRAELAIIDLDIPDEVQIMDGIRLDGDHYLAGENIRYVNSSSLIFPGNLFKYISVKTGISSYILERIMADFEDMWPPVYCCLHKNRPLQPCWLDSDVDLLIPHITYRVEGRVY